MYGIIGNEISYSASPRIHQSIAKLHKRKINYSLWDISPAAFSEKIPKLITRLQGANVTTPYKSQILPFLNFISDEARMTESCNTIYRHNNQLIGTNTDIAGVIATLKSQIPDAQQFYPIIFGSGGAARAVLQALTNLEIKEASLLSRGGKIISWLKTKFPKIELNGLPDKFHRQTLWINASPLGGPKNPEFTLIREHLERFNQPGDYFFDLNYQPKNNPLQSYADSLKMTVINGWHMLIYQALAAHQLWFPNEDWNNFPVQNLMKEINYE
ncbi:MAG TPA: hypothetical protein ENN84_08095 [Candidatus Marinimicrobia bacterium]|nr:hypothetical protein [Candidatus Neomarinimicrobiota bacterium]